MRRLTSIAAISLFIIFALIIYTSCQNADVSKPSNPLVGTWKPAGVVDSTGKAIEYFEDETGYHVFLEDGTFFTLGFRKNYVQTDVKPSTIEEFEKILENTWGSLFTYTVDEKNQKLHFKYIYTINPETMGTAFTLNYKIKGDTLIHWTDEGKGIGKAIRVK